MKNMLAILMVLTIAGCATTLTPEQKMRAIKAEANAKLIPVCKDEKECEIMWSRAVSFVVQHSKWKMQVQSDNLIQTYGPGREMKNAYTVTKTPEGEGYSINAKIGCGNPFGCLENPTYMLGLFNQYVRTGKSEI